MNERRKRHHSRESLKLRQRTRVNRRSFFEPLEARTLLATLFVDSENLPGPGTGTPIDPYIHIQDAIDAASLDDQVRVAAGEYHENISMKSGVDVIGSGAESTTIIGEATIRGVAHFQSVTDATLSGFTITVAAPVLQIDRGVVFHGTSPSTAVLEHNVLTGVQYGVFVFGTATPTIQNNTFFADANDEQGIYIGNNPISPTIRNNIVTGYWRAGIHVVAGEADPVPLIEFNNVWNNGEDYLRYPDQAGTNGNISTDPLFVSPSDFHLRRNSPAIDAGDPATGFDPDGTRSDMGALPFDQRQPAVKLTMPIDPLFVGQYAKVGVQFDPDSDLSLDDVEFYIPDGAKGGEISYSRDADFDPTHPDVMLLGGYDPGYYELVAVQKETREELASGTFSITTRWPSDVGPAIWVEGVVEPPAGVAGAAWGGGPVGPQNVDIKPAHGTHRVALILVDTDGARYPDDETILQAIRDRWMDEAEEGSPLATDRSVARYFQEVSYGELNVDFDMFGPFNLPGPWGDYFEFDDNRNQAPQATLWATGIAAGDDQINYDDYDSLVFISKESGTGFNAWPYASSTTATTAEGDGTFGVISMPWNWDSVDTAGRRTHETLSHELGHNLGLSDQYTPTVPNPVAPPSERNIDSWDLMHADNPFPHLTLAHRTMLGWVDPDWIEPVDFATAEVAVDRTITLSPIEQGAPGPGQKAGIEIRIADGKNYYIEYRSSQADQIGDQDLDKNDVVLITDVISPGYSAPIARPTILRVPHDGDDNGAVLQNGEKYIETDFSTPGFPVDFEISVSGIDGNKADVRIRYGVNGKPDPSIRPWPRPEHRYQSPDIEVQNARSLADPAWFNVPWAGQDNTVIAQVSNTGNVDADTVRVNFYVKDYTVGGAPETFIGFDVQDIAAGSTADFKTTWRPPAGGEHLCVVVRIERYKTPGMTPVEEMTEVNNEAQSNYARFISADASPASREISTITVGNPYDERTEVYLFISQDNPLYRTYLEHRWLELDPGETRDVQMMVEYAYAEVDPGHPLIKQYGQQPNTVNVHGMIRDPRSPDADHLEILGGVESQVVTGRKTRFEFVSTANAGALYGQVVTLSDGRGVSAGKALVELVSGSAGQEVTRYVEANVTDKGTFVAHVGHEWRRAAVHYLPPAGYGAATTEEIAAPGLVYDVPQLSTSASLVLRRNGTDLELIDEQSETVLRKLALETVQFVSITDPVKSRNTTLTLDFESGGEFAVPDGIDFDAGRRGDDAIRVRGGEFDTVQYIARGPDSGQLRFDQLVVNYANLEPIYDGSAARDREFVSGLPEGTLIQLDDQLAPHDGMMSIDSVASGVFFFRVPSARLTIHGGEFDDSIRIGSLDSLFRAELILAGGQGNDQIDFSTAEFGVDLDVDDIGGRQRINDERNVRARVLDRFESVIGSLFQDTIRVEASPYPRFISGGDPNSGDPGDTLVIDALGATVSREPSSIDVMGSAPINYFGIETLLLENAREFQEYSSNFEIDGPDSVPFRLFNVLEPGRVTIEVDWSGASDELNLALQGRERPELVDPYAPYAEVRGTSPLTLTYEVTESDLARGVGWRLVINDPLDAGDANGTIQMSVPFNTELNAAFQREKISMKSGDVWPTDGLQTEFFERLAATEVLHGFVTLNHAPHCDEEWLLAEMGVGWESVLPGRHYFGSVERSVNLNDPTITSAVRGFTPLEASDKIDPHILVGDYRRYEQVSEKGDRGNYVLNQDGTINVVVMFARDAANDLVHATLRRETIAFTTLVDGVYIATVDPSRLMGLANLDAVSWIEAAPAPGLSENNNTRAGVNANVVQNATVDATGTTITYSGLSGNGINVGVHDNGIDNTHNDLNVVSNVAAAGAHGTHVAGIISASGGQSAANGGAPFVWRGVAPQAGLIDSTDLVTASNLLNAIQNNSLDLWNRSQSFGFDGNYDAANQTLDSHVRGGSSSGDTPVPRRLIVTSAGNHGTHPWNQRPGGPGGLAIGFAQQVTGQLGYFSVTKQLKNSVVVGNWNATTNTLSPGSSLGPTYDGRIKPDVVAPGTNVTSTGFGTSANAYRQSSGTSMASPAVAGVTALMLEAWQNTYSTPIGSTIDADPPLPSTLRAALIQTSTDIVATVEDTNLNGILDAGEVDLNGNGVADQGVTNGRQNPDVDRDNVPGNANDGTGFVTATVGPDFATGWGLVNAAAAVQLVQDSRTERGVPIPNRIIQDSVHQAGIREYDFVVDTAQDLRVTMAWDDVEFSTTAVLNGGALINDLDLELVAPDGTIYYPWQLGQTILDAAGNPLANNAQPPGTAIQVQRPLLPIDHPSLPPGAQVNPTFTYVVAPAGAGNNWSPNAVGAGPGNVDYVPANAVAPGGVWSAGTGKDHLNNVEQVFVPAGQVAAGHWTVRVIGFDVQIGGPQDFSVVGFPYPDLPELVVSADDTVGFGSFNDSVDISWTVANFGTVNTGVEFDYKVWLSSDFTVDATDALVDQGILTELIAGESVAQATSITITADHARQVLGKAPGAAVTANELIDGDVILVLQVDGDNVVLEHNEINLAPMQTARLVDVVLVMDQSGSMSSTVTLTSGADTPKLALLQKSANLFLDLLRQDTGDQLAEVAFAGGLTTPTDFGTLTQFTSDNIDDARTFIDGLTADGDTNIHAGLQYALDALPPIDDGDARRRVVILFSDGMQTVRGADNPRDLLPAFDEQDVHVYTVGFGTEGGSGNAGIDIALLQALAGGDGQGFTHVTQEAVRLDKFFVQALAASIESQVILDPVEEIVPGDMDSVEIPVNRQDSEVTFILTWDDPAEHLDLTVKAPNGLEIGSTNASRFGGQVSVTDKPGYQFITVNMPLTAGAGDDHGGVWRMVINNRGGRTVEYSASAITRSTLEAETLIPRNPGHTFHSGDPIPVQARVHGRDGTPITTSTASVVANVPLVSVGTLLAGAAISDAELAAVPREINGETLNHEARMLLALRNRVGGGELLPRADLAPVQLGRGQTAGDFIGNFATTDVAGTYDFTVKIQGQADCSPFQREFSHSVDVAPTIELIGPILIRSAEPDDPGDVVVRWTPRTNSGGYLGPGLFDQFTVGVDGPLRLVGDVVDHFDGSYSWRLERVDRLEPGQAVVRVARFGDQSISVRLDTSLPAPASINPAGGRNDTATGVAISVRSGTDVTDVEGITLVGPDGDFELSHVSIDDGAGVIRATVPRGLPIATYDVHLETSRGRGPSSNGVTYQALASGRDVPRYVGRMQGALDNLTQATDRTERFALLGDLLLGLRETPVGSNFTRATRQAAVNQVASLVLRGQSEFDVSSLSRVYEGLNRSRIDARFMPSADYPTPLGERVDVALNNGISVIFDEVITAGATTVDVRPGPAIFGAVAPDTIHAGYDIRTRATLTPAAGIEVEIAYEDGDYGDESAIRIYQLENRRWVDRTTSLDAANNRIRARLTSLEPLAIAPASAILSHDLERADYVELTELDPSTGDFHFVFEAEHQGLLTVEARGDELPPDTHVELYDGSGRQLLTEAAGNGETRRIDWPVATPGERYYVRLAGATNNVDLKLGNLVRFAEKAVTVAGTSSTDVVTIGDSSTPDALTVNNLTYSLSQFDTATSFAIQAGDGDDTIDATHFSSVHPLSLAAGAGDDVLIVSPANLGNIDGGPGNDELRLVGQVPTFDLAAVELGQLTGLETIDVRQLDGIVSLDQQSVQRLSDESDTLTVLSNAENAVLFDAGWTLTGGAISGDQFYRVLENQSAQVLLDAPLPWQNPLDPLDVNADGVVTPIDVLIGINEANHRKYSHSDARLLDPRTLSSFPGHFLDSNGDGFFTPIDDLMIINELNRKPASSESAREPAQPELLRPSADLSRLALSYDAGHNGLRVTSEIKSGLDAPESAPLDTWMAEYQWGASDPDEPIRTSRPTDDLAAIESLADVGLRLPELEDVIAQLSGE